jgi:hypothetical protein
MKVARLGQERASTWEGTEENYNIFRWYKSGWRRYTQADPLDTRSTGVINGRSEEVR